MGEGNFRESPLGDTHPISIGVGVPVPHLTVKDSTT